MIRAPCSKTGMALRLVVPSKQAIHQMKAYLMFVEFKLGFYEIIDYISFFSN